MILLNFKFSRSMCNQQLLQHRTSQAVASLHSVAQATWAMSSSGSRKLCIIKHSRSSHAPACCLLRKSSCAHACDQLQKRALQHLLSKMLCWGSKAKAFRHASAGRASTNPPSLTVCSSCTYPFLPACLLLYGQSGVPNTALVFGDRYLISFPVLNQGVPLLHCVALQQLFCAIYPSVQTRCASLSLKGWRAASAV